MKLEQIIQLDERYYMNTFGKRFPVAFTHGQGCTLYDTLGREYTDFFSGIAVNCLGYAHPAFTRAMCEQMGKYIHISNLYYVEQQALLAQRLCENSCVDKVFFANSGAEAPSSWRASISTKRERRNTKLFRPAIPSMAARWLPFRQPARQNIKNPIAPLCPPFAMCPMEISRPWKRR